MFGRMKIPSLAVSDELASHRIVGQIKTDNSSGGGVLGYYTRLTVGDALNEFLEIDPNAILRVEPHNEILNGAALRSTDVEWIVNNVGELGVKIGDQFIFLYKGEGFMYTGASPEVSTYRRVGKREFGESGPISPYPYNPSDGWMDINFSTARNEIAYSTDQLP